MIVIATRPKKKKQLTTAEIAKLPLYCTCCGKELKDVTNDTYGSKSSIWSFYQRMLVCKPCLDNDFNQLLERFSYDVKKAFYYFAMKYDIPYMEGLLNSSAKYVETHPTTKIYARYMTTYLSFYSKNNYVPCFLDGEDALVFPEEDIENEEQQEQEQEQEIVKKRKTRMTDADKQNKKDVLNILGFDPFESEPERDKKYLYNKLIDFLDDSTQQDNFKIPVVIEITKGFSHVEKLNELINQIYESDNAIQCGKEIKELITTRTNALGSILSMAKDNGISANYNNSKSKGAGTLSGILKDLQNKRFMEAEVHLFDIQTCDGIKQIAEISDRSIVGQMRFDENSYSEMIVEQRNLISEKDKQILQLEENLRVAKIQLAQKVKEG